MSSEMTILLAMARRRACCHTEESCIEPQSTPAARLLKCVCRREFLGDFGFNNRHPDRSGSPHSHNQHSVPHNKPSDTGGAYDGFKVEDA
jgi:hypothetical protein